MKQIKIEHQITFFVRVGNYSIFLLAELFPGLIVYCTTRKRFMK
jgi:hypothetical protein